jgi:poly(A) polymerase
MARKSDSARARRAAEEIVGRLRDAGHVAYFAGGCVRDELLGLEPTDYDVATDATPQRVAALFDHTNEVGAAFGVVLVGLERGGPVVEVATFRSDGAYSDRRRPDDVRFSDPESDARRRDFTVNALFLDPLAPPTPGAPGASGRVIDFVGGIADLGRRTLRAVGEADQRLAEDHLRALRGVRLAARLNFSLDGATARAIREHATELQGVSRERIGDELRRMMGHPTRAIAVGLLQELRLDVAILDKPTRGAGLARAVAALPMETPYATALAAWALDRHAEPGEALPQTQVAGLVSRWRGALCLSNEETISLRDTLHGVGLLTQGWTRLSVALRKRAAAEGWFTDALSVLDSLDRVVSLERAEAVRRDVAELAGRHGGLKPEPWVNGDLLVAKGLKPGPAFKKILDEVYDAQLEGRVSGPEQAVALAVELSRR